jgi:hypothetical protein
MLRDSTAHFFHDVGFFYLTNSVILMIPYGISQFFGFALITMRIPIQLFRQMCFRIQMFVICLQYLSSCHVGWYSSFWIWIRNKSLSNADINRISIRNTASFINGLLRLRKPEWFLLSSFPFVLKIFTWKLAPHTPCTGNVFFYS